MTTKCDKTAMKHINIGAILRTCLSKDTISQTDLTNLTGLKKATVSNLVNSLKDKGLLINLGEGKSGNKGGRKQRFLGINKEKIFAIGVSIRATNLKAGLFNLAGKTLWENEVEFEKIHSTLWIPEIIKIISKATTEMVKPGHVFLGAGVAIGGMYDPRVERFIQFSLQEPYGLEKNINIRAQLQEKLKGVQIITDDFPNAMALGEVWFGCAKELDDFVYLQLENLKATVVNNKTIFRGHGMYAGQVGGWRYGRDDMRINLLNSGYSMDMLTDFCTNILLSYAPDRIILSRENLPKAVTLDVEDLNKRLAARFKEINLNGFSGNIVEMGGFDRERRALAAAALVFDDYFHSYILN